MANWVFTGSAGRVMQYASLAMGTDQIVVLLLQSTGLQADATLRNYTALNTLLGSNTECTFSNYARKIITSPQTVTTNTTTHVNTLTMTNWTWTAAGGALNNTIGKLLVCWRPTSATTDAGTVPVIGMDCTATTTGSDLLVQINASGLATATAS